MQNRKNTNRDITRAIVCAIALLYILVLIFTGTFGDMGLIKNFKLRSQNEGIREKVEDIKDQNNKLRREIDNLRGNQRYIEKIAREELNMSREDEVTFIFSDK